MKQHLMCVLALASTLAVSAQKLPSILKSNGSTGNDVAYSISPDENNNIYVSGNLAGTLTDGAISLSILGATDIYIAKYKPNGQLVWAKTAGGVGNDGGYAIKYHKGFVYVSGMFNGTATFGSQTLTSKGQDDGYIAKYDSSGNFVWVKQFGSTWLDRVDNIVFTENDQMYACASLGDGTMVDGNTLDNEGGIDGYILKLDATGQMIDYINVGGSSNDYGYGLISKMGSLYLTGMYNSNSMTIGSSTVNKVGQYDGFVVKMDTTFAASWVKSYGGNEYDGGNKTLIDDNENVYVAGYITGNVAFGSTSLTGTSGITDGFLAKYDASGTLQWVKKAGANSFCHYRDLKFGDSQSEILAWGHYKGNIVIDGTTYSSAAAAQLDFFSVSYDPSGAISDVNTYGGVNEEAVCEAIPVGDDIWACGSFTTSTVFNGITYSSVGGADIGLWKLSEPATGIRTIGASLHTITALPNPSNGFIELRSDKKVSQVAIFDQLGKCVYQKDGMNNTRVSLELGLPDGVYFIQANTEAGVLQQKLVIKQ